MLHGEQYLAIKTPIPVQADLVSEARSVTATSFNITNQFECYTCRLLEVLDKGKAAAVTSIVQTKDKNSGEVIFENQSTVFIRGSGGFGGKTKGNGSCSIIAAGQKITLHCCYVLQTVDQQLLPMFHRSASLTLLLKRRPRQPKQSFTGESKLVLPVKLTLSDYPQPERRLQSIACKSHCL